MHYVLNANPQFITENSHQFTTQSVIQNTPSVVSGASSAQIIGLDVNHTLPSNSSNTVQYIHAGTKIKAIFIMIILIRVPTSFEHHYIINCKKKND